MISKVEGFDMLWGMISVNIGGLIRWGWFTNWGMHFFGGGRGGCNSSLERVII